MSDFRAHCESLRGHEDRKLLEYFFAIFCEVMVMHFIVRKKFNDCCKQKKKKGKLEEKGNFLNFCFYLGTK